MGGSGGGEGGGGEGGGGEGGGAGGGEGGGGDGGGEGIVWPAQSVEAPRIKKNFVADVLAGMIIAW